MSRVLSFKYGMDVYMATLSGELGREISDDDLALNTRLTNIFAYNNEDPTLMNVNRI